jgi:hypothetical protein
MARGRSSARHRGAKKRKQLKRFPKRGLSEKPLSRKPAKIALLRGNLIVEARVGEETLTLRDFIDRIEARASKLKAEGAFKLLGEGIHYSRMQALQEMLPEESLRLLENKKNRKKIEELMRRIFKNVGRKRREIKLDQVEAFYTLTGILNIRVLKPR